MAVNAIHSITGRLGWGQAKALPREDHPVRDSVVEKAPPRPAARRRIVSQGRASDHMAEFNHIVGRINYDVDRPLEGTRFADYFSGSLETVRTGRRREKRVGRNKAVLVLTVFALVAFWAVARFFWPA